MRLLDQGNDLWLISMLKSLAGGRGGGGCRCESASGQHAITVMLTSKMCDDLINLIAVLPGRPRLIPNIPGKDNRSNERATGRALHRSLRSLNTNIPPAKRRR